MSRWREVDAERYSYASDNSTKLDSGTEFAELINNATPSEAWALMDELILFALYH